MQKTWVQSWYGRTPHASGGEGNGNPLQYSCLENPRDRGAWPAMVHGVAEGQTELSTWQIDTHADKAAVRTVISDMI